MRGRIAVTRRALLSRRAALFGLALLVLLILAAGELRPIGGRAAIVWWADGGWTLCAGAALGGCLRAARRGGPGHRAWLLFAAGCGAWLLGQTVWNYYQLVAHAAPPFPSLGDAGWLGFVPLFGAGILSLPRPRVHANGVAFAALDLTIVALALTLLGVLADQGLLLTSTSVPVWGKIVGLAYPISYLTLGLGAFLLMARVPALAAARGMALLLVGLLCEGGGFVAWVPLLLRNTYHDGTPLDVVWMAGLLAIGLAGLEWRPLGDQPVVGGVDTRARVALGLIPTLLGTGAALVAHICAFGPARSPLAIGTGSLIVLIALRQIAAVLENVRLYQAEATQRRLAQRRAERLRRVQELGQALRLDLDPERINRLVVDSTVEAFGYRVAILNLITDPAASTGDQRIRAMATAGLAPDIAEHFMGQDAPAADVFTVLRPEFRVSRSYFLPMEQASVALDDTAIPRWTPPTEEDAVSSDGWQPGDEFLIPLTEPRTNGFLGFISVDQPLDGRRPDVEAVEMLEIFADQAALAVENARLYAEAHRLYERAQAQALRDPVTELANHRAVHQVLDAALCPTGGERGEAPTAVLLLDVDNFKLFNDTYGHPTGDAVLRQVADHLRACARDGDVAARYGGDEFAVVLPGADYAAGRRVADRLMRAVAATPYAGDDGATIPLSVSIGVAAAPLDGQTRQELLALADARMYAAKRGSGADPTLMRSAADLLGETTFGILEGLVAAVDAKDRYTREHSLDVTHYALMLADAVGLDDENRRTLAVAGPLHDVGKIAVPDRVLLKPGRLTDDEYASIKTHVTYGVAIVRGLLDDPHVLGAIACHHERWDGAGYPAGLRGDETPLVGRILQIADAVSAMALDRPYRRGLPLERVVAELRRGAGAQFDPALVEPFIAAFLQERDAPCTPSQAA